MDANKTIVGMPRLRATSGTLVAAVKAADRNPGRSRPVTMFADERRLFQAARRDGGTLLKPENKIWLRAS
jgi:hypothetical protein